MELRRGLGLEQHKGGQGAGVFSRGLAEDAGEIVSGLEVLFEGLADELACGGGGSGLGGVGHLLAPRRS